MSAEQLTPLKQELNKNLLNPNEYIAVYEYLIEIGANDLAKQIIITALLSYPNIGRIKHIAKTLKIDNNKTLSNKDKIKVFCIGLSRTGTNSLSDALKVLGLNGKHWNGENSQILDWHDIEKFDFLSDTPVSFIFEALYYAYPDAYFIYTTRDRGAWVRSMDNHFKWANGFDGFKNIVGDINRGSEGSIIREPIWGTIHKNLYTNAASWGDAYDRFDQRVKKFFSGKDNTHFLPFDISLEDTTKWQLLCGLFNLDFVPLRGFPRKNIKIQSFEHNRATIDAIVTGVDKKITSEFQVIDHRSFIIDTVPAQEPLSLPIPSTAKDFYAFTRTSGIRKALDIIEIEDCYLSLDFSKAYSAKYYIFDSNKGYLEKISYGEEPFIAEDIIAVDQTVGFVEDKFSQFNICHLLLDKLPRTELLNEKPDSILLFKQNEYTDIICKKLNLNQFNIAKFAGLKHVTIKFKKLSITSSSSYDFIHPGQNISSHVVNTLNRIKNSVAKPIENKKIFIDRKDASSRNVINYNETIVLLKSHGFDIIQPEKLSVEEQIQLFSSATAVVAVHGAGLTNIAFCTEGTKIVELMPSLCGTNAFWKLATALNLNYHALLTQDEELDKPDYSTWKHQPALYNRRDVIVSIDQLELLLKDLQ